MLFLSQIRDWIRQLAGDSAENYYIGKMNAKEKSVGVFQLSSRPPTMAIGQSSGWFLHSILTIYIFILSTCFMPSLSALIRMTAAYTNGSLNLRSIMKGRDTNVSNSFGSLSLLRKSV